MPALPGSAAAPGNTTEAKLKAPAKALPSSPDAADKAAKQDTEKHADVQSPLAKVESSSSQPIASSSKVKLEDLPKTPQETPPETLAETSAETPPDTQAVEDPGFKMPARAQRFGQPVDRDKPGFSLLETNKLRPGASMAAAVGISTHTTVGAADAALVGGSVTAAHESLGAVINGHAFLAATQRKKRYGAQLDSMLKDDLGKLDENRRNGVAMPPETMIFKRKNGIRKLEDVYDPKAAKRDGKRRDDGKTAAASSAKPIELEYDMEAVKRLAASDDPKLKNESAHAKNVLLTAYLKDDVAAKQGNRAAYEFIRNTVAISAATATAVGTHGAAVAVAGTHAAHVAAGTRIAGSAISGASSLDVAKGIRGLKQRMRNDKAEVVDSYALQRRQAFAEEYAGPKATPEKKAVMSKLEESGDKEKVVKDTHRAFLEQARVQAGKETFGRVFKGSSIDDTRSTTAKKEMRDVVGKHAYTVVNYHMGLSDPKKSEHLAGEWDKIMKTPNSTRKSRQKQFADLFDKDPGTKTAYHLLRDTGMGRGESIYTMQRMIEMSIETKMAADPEMAAVGGSADFAKDDAAQKATTSRLTTAMGRR
ncbi:hypothetical protein [Paraburkholderia sp. BCC1885]|uniref:hypothetical protein n=1 Tax=Paraburkholderia sp. BCC1885 TaxID=2562669 RepID=UPI001183C47B|nr:hypothetical protein [Paraburkholderia sp. BCC1885]